MGISLHLYHICAASHSKVKQTMTTLLQLPLHPLVCAEFPVFLINPLKPTDPDMRLLCVVSKGQVPHAFLCASVSAPVHGNASTGSRYGGFWSEGTTVLATVLACEPDVNPWSSVITLSHSVHPGPMNTFSSAPCGWEGHAAAELKVLDLQQASEGRRRLSPSVGLEHIVWISAWRCWSPAARMTRLEGCCSQSSHVGHLLSRRALVNPIHSAITEIISINRSSSASQWGRMKLQSRVRCFFLFFSEVIGVQSADSLVAEMAGNPSVIIS